MIKTLDRYFISLFLKKLLILTVIFFLLSFILTIFEEITFLSETKSAFYLPFMLAIFDAPTTLLEIFPFVILIAAQLFFIDLIKKKENELVKINNLDNFYLIKLLTLCSFIFGLWHLYLGWKHVIKTALVGAFLCGIYLFFESIVIVIIAHILMDVYSGTIAFYAKKASGLRG